MVRSLARKRSGLGMTTRERENTSVILSEAKDLAIGHEAPLIAWGTPD